jgi:hypothetical protein
MRPSSGKSIYSEAIATRIRNEYEMIVKRKRSDSGTKAELRQNESRAMAERQRSDSGEIRKRIDREWMVRLTRIDYEAIANRSQSSRKAIVNRY